MSVSLCFKVPATTVSYTLSLHDALPILTDAREMEMVWGVRKAGLSLLTGCVGAAKPVAFIEDAAVRPAQLPEYVRGDRKSTRLNSSHSQISYAVFCLKKKRQCSLRAASG